MHFGPHEVLLNLDLRFRDGLSVSEINEAIDRIERTLRDRHPDVNRIFIEMDSLRTERHANHVSMQEQLAQKPAELAFPRVDQ